VLAADFIGSAYPVNRDGEPVGGVRAYSSIADVPDVVDLVVICLPGPLVLDAAEAALSRSEQSGVVADEGVERRLQESNQAYEQRFGHGGRWPRLNS
jgi:acyl-CoA synthetase (NDP forming)